MGLLPPILVELRANASEFHSKMGDAQKELDNLASAGATKGEKFKAGLTSAFAGAGAAFAGLGGLLTSEGMKGQQATTTLETAVKNAGGSIDELGPKFEGLAGHMANFGHNNVDTEMALARLTDATGDPKKALDQMGLVADIAARKHISLADAADLVGKVDIGKGGKALTQFGIAASKSADSVKLLSAAAKAHESAVDAQGKATEKLTDLQERLRGKTNLSVAETQALRHAHEDVDAATKKVTDTTTALASAQSAAAGSTDDVATNLDKLQGKVMGSASAQSDTLAGKLSSLKAHLENVADSIGQKVGPALTVAGPLIMGMGSMLETNLIPTLAKGVVGAVTWSASMVASAAAAAAGWLADMALMVASSIASAAAMIAPFLPLILAIAAIGIAAYELYEHWDEVWGFIKGIVVGVFNWLKDNWPLVLGILLGPMALAVGEIIQHWDTVVEFVTGLPGKISSAARGMWDGIKEAFRGAINWIIHAWNDLEFKIPGFHQSIFGHEVGFDGFTLGVPDITPLAAGGIVTSPTFALIGERGPEAVIPLSRGGLGGGFTWNGDLIVNGTDDPQTTAAAVRDEVLRLMRRNVSGGLG